MKNFYTPGSFFVPQHKFKIKNGGGGPSFSGNNDYFLYDERQGFKKSQRDIPKGFIKPDIPAEPVKEPDYLEQNFGQYGWHGAEGYRNSSQPFFTGKDPLDNFIKPVKAPVGNSFHANNEADFEAQNGFQEANCNRGKSHEEITKEIISQRPLDYKEFYGEPEGEIQQNIRYQDGTEEINEAMRNTFGDSFEINRAVDEVKQSSIAQNQDLSQQEINNEDTTPAPEPQEPQSEAEMQGITPMADTMEPKDLEGIVEAEQLQPEEMMQKPMPDPFDPFMMPPGFFGP